MRIAHIILAHTSQNHLKKLINAICDGENSDIYIHIDAKIPLHKFENLTANKTLYFIKNRIKCNWGGFSILQAIFNSLGEIIASGKKYDFVNLLSGLDYPIKPIPEINQFLSENLNKNFISYDDFNSDWWEKAQNRYTKYHLTDFNFKGKNLIQKFLNKILPERKFPKYTNLFGSNKGTWWTISFECSKYIYNEFNSDEKFKNFIRLCWGTDEFIIPTMIMNSPFSKDTINNNLRYIDWTEGNSSPKLLKTENFNAIKHSNMLFARKFDCEIDASILEKIDRLLQ